MITPNGTREMKRAKALVPDGVADLRRDADDEHANRDIVAPSSTYRPLSAPHRPELHSSVKQACTGCENVEPILLLTCLDPILVASSRRVELTRKEPLLFSGTVQAARGVGRIPSCMCTISGVDSFRSDATAL